MAELKVATGTVGFQDAKGVQRMYETVSESGCFTHKFYIDCPFEGVETNLDNSNDGSIEVAKSFDAEIVLMSKKTEYEARMKYLELCRVFDIDFLLIIDTDEYVLRADQHRFLEHLQEIKDSNTDHNVFAVEVQFAPLKYGEPMNPRKIQFNERPRMWFKPGEMTYVRGSHSIFKNINHDNYYYPGTHMVDMHDTIRGIWLNQDKTYRSEARAALQQKYADNVLIPKELDIKRMQAVENMPGRFF